MVVTVRVAVLLSILVMLVVGPDFVRAHLDLAWPIILIGCAYAFAVFRKPRWERRGTPAAWLVSGMDGLLGLVAIALTGSARSPLVVALVLVVVAAAIRLPIWSTMILTSMLGIGYVGIALLVEPHVAPFGDRLFTSVWWATYLLITAVLGASLSRLAAHEHEAKIAARVEAIAEHQAAEEERDLRTRLLDSYQAQQDALNIILHEFRTPITSLTALLRESAQPTTPGSEEGRMRGASLAAQHAKHLAEMLDALADVAASHSPSFTAGRVRNVNLHELILAAGHAAGLRSPQLRVALDEERDVRVDAQLLRRILTNLLENAARHGQGDHIDVHAWTEAELLHVRVLDRGSGVSPDQLGKLTDKYTALGNRRGNVGLGLWIVEQIVQAMGGQLELGTRSGGGLVVQFAVPMS